MAGHLAIVAYRCVIEDKATGSIDFQVRWFAESDPTQVRRLIASESEDRYIDSNGDEARWEFVEVFAVEEFEPSHSGDEVIGFIADTDELRKLA